MPGAGGEGVEATDYKGRKVFLGAGGSGALLHPVHAVFTQIDTFLKIHETVP